MKSRVVVHDRSGVSVRQREIRYAHNTPEQREALFKNLTGEGQPAGSIFQIFSVIVEKVHDPAFLPITFEWDMARRTGRVEVPGVVHASTTLPVILLYEKI